MKKFLVLTVLITFFAVVFPHLFARAQNQELSALVSRQERDLAKIFKKHERIKLNTAEVAEQIRTNLPVSIYTPSASFHLVLKPHDMRARNYRAAEVGADGVERSIAMGDVRTYKGEVLGIDDAQARFTLDDATLEGLIVTPQERYMVEPMRKYSIDADATDFVFYKSSDVIENDQGAGEGVIDRELRHTANDIAPKVAQAFAVEAATAVVHDMELATEADAEYVTALGGSAAANNEILSIMNMVEGIYQSQLDLSFTIVFQHTWTSAASDPYSATAPGGCYNNTVCGGPPPNGLDKKGILNEFMEYWNTNFPASSPSANNPRRDLAHMWTGKDMDGSTIGLAWLGVVCQAPAYSYGLSQRITSAPVKYAVTAHEIGHNFNAQHSDGQASCPNTIMNSSSSSSSVLQFCPYSINQITTYANAQSSCLAVGSACSFTISPTSTSVTSSGGTGSGSVTTACSWTAVSNAAWVTITAGSSGNGNGTVTYTVAANTGAASRSGTMTIAGQTFTVTQAAASVSTYTISGKVTISGTTTVLAGVTMKLTGARVRTATTNSLGAFSFTDLPTGNYRVTPSKLGYLFTPTYRGYTAVGANQVANFTATARTFTITAKATYSGVALVGVTMKLTGSRALTCTTSSAGTCQFTNLPAGGNYTVTPSRTGFTFTPASKLYSNLASSPTSAFSSP